MYVVKKEDGHKKNSLAPFRCLLLLVDWQRFLVSQYLFHDSAVVSRVAFGSAFLGFKLQSLQDEVVELEIKYDDYYQTNPICGIGDTFNANKTCLLNFTAPENLSPPILIHYELTNFHQNHRSYYQSRDDYQLLGHVGQQDTVSENRCKPLHELGGIKLNPCG